MIKMILQTGAAVVATAAALVVAPQAHADEVCQFMPKVVAVGPTSCPFAINVANAMMSGDTSSVYSPTTGQSYRMTCRIEHHGSTTCRGDDAEVDIY